MRSFWSPRGTKARGNSLLPPFLPRVLFLILMLSPVPGFSGTALPNCEHHTDNDQIALACNIYWEARTEGYEGMLAVVAVTLNRLADPAYPDILADVVWQRRQFSWTHDGKIDRPRNRPSWAQAMALARRFAYTSEEVSRFCPTATQIIAAMLGRPDPGCDTYWVQMQNKVNIIALVDPTKGSLFYHAEYIPPPYWVVEESRVAKIGRHIFYTAARVR